MDRLGEIFAKIERAKRHISDLESRIADLKRLKNCRLVIEQDADTRERIYRVYPARSIPTEIALIIGDAIHNLRSAIDHLVCHMVVANGNTISRNNQFPIKHISSSVKVIGSSEVEHVPLGAVQLIEDLQPRNTGVDDLWVLHRLDAHDKHMLLLVVGYVDQTIGVAIGANDPSAGKIGIFRQFNSILPDEGAEIGRITGVDGLKNNVEEELNASFNIAFGKMEVAEGEPVLALLYKMTDTVERIVQQFTEFL